MRSALYGSVSSLNRGDLNISHHAIREAFAKTQLNSGLSVRQCVALDNREDSSLPKYADIIDCISWFDIPDSQMHYFGTHGVLIHGGLDGCLFHLPAALTYVSNNISTLSDYGAVWDILSSITNQLEKAEVQQMLGSAQREAVICCLASICINIDTETSLTEEIMALCNQLKS